MLLGKSNYPWFKKKGDDELKLEATERTRFSLMKLTTTLNVVEAFSPMLIRKQRLSVLFIK